MYVVLGATGQIGGAVASRLLVMGHDVTIVTRSPSKARNWQQRGARPAIIDIHDTPALAALFKDAQRAFLLNPPAAPALDTDAEERKTVRSILAALENSGLEKLVVQSTYAAQPGSHCGDLGSLYEFEEGARKIGKPLCIVRAAYYMSNWLPCWQGAAQSGVLPSLLPARLPVPMAAPADVGHLGADLLAAPLDHVGTYNIEGPVTYCPLDVAQAWEAALQRPISVVEIPPEDWIAHYRQNGFSEHAARSYANMTAIFIRQLSTSPPAPIRGETDLRTYFQNTINHP